MDSAKISDASRDLKIGLVDASLDPTKDPRDGVMPHYTSGDRIANRIVDERMRNSEIIRKNLKHYKAYDFYDENNDYEEISIWKMEWEEKDNAKYKFVFFNGDYWGFDF